MKTILIAIIIAILLYLSYNKIIDIPMNYVIILAIISLILTYDCNSLEHLTDSAALQNVASLYNSGTATLTNLHLTGKLTVDGGGTFGHVFIGDATDGWGGIGHTSKIVDNKLVAYSGIQFHPSNGTIYMNGPPSFSIDYAGNVSSGPISSGNITSSGSITSGSITSGNINSSGNIIASSGTFGNTFIGDAAGDWFGIGSKNWTTNNKLRASSGIQMQSTGNTWVNGTKQINVSGIP